jgi:hypothetical protein
MTIEDLEKIIARQKKEISEWESSNLYLRNALDGEILNRAKDRKKLAACLGSCLAINNER